MADVERDRDIEWLLTCSDSAMGERGTMGAVVSMIEKGGASTHAEPATLTDRQLGWSEDGERLGDVERARRLQSAWRRLSKAHREILCLRYLSRNDLPHGVVQHLGPLAGLALYLAPKPDRVLKACSLNLSKADRELITATLRRAERANMSAHVAWREARREQYEAWASEWLGEDDEPDDDTDDATPTDDEIEAESSWDAIVSRCAKGT